MRNAVSMLVYNQVPEQLALTKEAVASVLAQDIPIDLFLIDNGSTDGTWEWMQSIASDRITIEHHEQNLSPVLLSNWWMDELFNRLCYSHILGVPNDAILPPNFYREMLTWPRGIVAASMTGERDFPYCEASSAVNTCTPMAVALIRKWAWEAMIDKDGYFFDPQFFLYASDCDFALRLAACGITGIQLDMQYFHYSSACWRLLPPELGRLITDQADKDRAYFERKWGFSVSDERYGKSAADINFKGVGK